MESGPGEGSKRLGVRTTVAIIFARLVLVPLAGVGITMLVDKLGFIPEGDRMFKFVLLLQHSMPTSVLSGMWSQQGMYLISYHLSSCAHAYRFLLTILCVEICKETTLWTLTIGLFVAGAVANLRGCGKESAAILFWVHIFAVFSMAGWIIFYLSLLF